MRCGSWKAVSKREAVGAIGRTFKEAVVLGIAIVATGSASANVDLMLNGNFEGPVGNFTANAGPGVTQLDGGSSALTGWDVIGGLTKQGAPTGIAWESNANPQGFQASDGSYFLNLAGSDGLSHRGGVSTDASIGTISGQYYALSFDLGSCSASGGDGVNPVVKVMISGAGSRYFIGNNNVSGTGSHWQTETMVFEANSSATFITFNNCTGLKTTDAFVGLDNIRLEVTTVPEAGTWAAGLGGLALMIAAFGLSAKKPKAAA